MSRFARVVVASVMSAAMLLPNLVQAMEIRQFDKMPDQDQAEYLGLLLQGAEKVFSDGGRSDLAVQVDRLFLTIPAGDEISLGMTEFERNLALARVADMEKTANDPNAHRLEVEDAMLVTLKKNTIPLSQDFIRSFRALYIDFKPKAALITHNADGTFTIQKQRPSGNSKDAEVKNGLVIPPQVVVPIIPARGNKP